MPLSLLLTTTVGLISPGKRGLVSLCSGAAKPVKNQSDVFVKDVENGCCAALATEFVWRKKNIHAYVSKRSSDGEVEKEFKWAHSLTWNGAGLTTRVERCCVLQRPLLLQNNINHKADAFAKHTNLKVISGRRCANKSKDAEHNVLQNINRENKVNREIYSRGQGSKDVTYFVELMEANGYAHHDDGEGTVVPPSVACWTWRGR